MNLIKSDKIGIGFATGRKSFQRVLRTTIQNWDEFGLVENKRLSLNLFIAYDLEYNNTKERDYTNVSVDLRDKIDTIKFIGRSSVNEDIQELIDYGVITHQEASRVFGKGYAANRNIVLYNAIKAKMDCLVFLDDDEYPVAVTNTRKTALWGGQSVLATHLRHIAQADITHGHHCGYISPIPFLEFNDVMAEDDFRRFIEAISNDIVNWDKIRGVMENGGVTYADTAVLTTDQAFEVEEIGGAKFISGANLCINLKDPNRVFPFYNPPGARGEDTFLSTCLTDRKVLRVPCYTFHDGFSTYNHLLEGVLPIKLKFIKADSDLIINRFYKACIGWIRYKPLLMQITDPDSYVENIAEMKRQLQETLPKVCAFFDSPDFMTILRELNKYDKNVNRHAHEFNETKRIWAKIMHYLS